MKPTNPGWPLVRERVQEFERLHYQQLSAVIKLHRFIEKWSIIDYRLTIFGRAFGYQHNQVLRRGSALSEVFRKILPVDNPETPGFAYPYSTPQPRHLAEVSEVAARYQDESHLIGAYISDLNVELQALLLGHLFGRRVQRRDPPDPAKFTIRLDRYRALKRHFDGTEYYSDAMRAEREFRAANRRERMPPWRKWLQKAFRRIDISRRYRFTCRRCPGPSSLSSRLP